MPRSSSTHTQIGCANGQPMLIPPRTEGSLLFSSHPTYFLKLLLSALKQPFTWAVNKSANRSGPFSIFNTIMASTITMPMTHPSILQM